MKHSRILAVLLLCLTLLAPGAQAQKFLENYKKPMPDIKLAPAADFEAATTAYSDTPFNDQALSFSVRIPKDWQKQRDVSMSNAAVGTKILGELVRFYGPPKGEFRSYMTIQALKLEYKLTAEQWFIQYLLANSYTLQGIKTYDDRHVEGLYVYVENDVTYVVRTFAVINGTRVVMAQYFLPVDHWDDEKQMQAQMVESFVLTHPTDEFVEPMATFHFLDIADLKYPTSWELTSPPLTTIDRMSAKLLSIASTETVKRKTYKLLNGRIDLELVSHYAISSIRDELKNYKAELGKSGLMVEDYVETKDNFIPNVNKNFAVRPIEVYSVVDTDNQLVGYELWLLLMEAGDYYYIVSLLTPSRDEDYFIWSRNTQTMRTIVETMTPREGSIVGN